MNNKNRKQVIFSTLYVQIIIIKEILRNNVYVINKNRLRIVRKLP